MRCWLFYPTDTIMVEYYCMEIIGKYLLVLLPQLKSRDFRPDV